MKKSIKQSIIIVTICLFSLLLCCCENQQQENPDMKGKQQLEEKVTQGMVTKGTWKDGVVYRYNKETAT